MKINTLKINTIIVILIMLLSKFLAFFKDILISKNFGMGIKTDAYNIVYLVIISLFGLFGSALTNSIMPILTDKYVKNREEFDEVKNIIITLMTLITVCIIIFIIYNPNIFIKILAKDVNENTFTLSSYLLKFGSLSLLFLALNSIIGAILRIYNYIIIPTISNIIFPLPGILVLIFSGNNIELLTLSLTLGYILQFIFQFLFLIFKGVKFKFNLRFNNQNIINILKLMPPMILSSGVLQISSIFDNRVASNFGEGSITALSLAIKINGLFFTVFATASMQAIYPVLTKLYAEAKHKEFKYTISKQAEFITILIMPVMIIMALMSEDIVKILFFRGDFTISDVIKTANILSCFSLGLVFYVLRDICNYAFFSLGDSRTPSKISILVVCINILNNYLFSYFMGINGIALATAFSGILSFFILYFVLNKRLDGIRILSKNLIVSIICSSIVMITSLILLKSIIKFNFINTLIIILFSTICYFITLILFDFSEFKKIVVLFNKKIRK
ncbi:MAG: murein biosynthesis integral membrane protein MurJ [Clostridium perfringens]|nr:murein biosynthesis integral membrane protein MurJ [Clostridium perfringens]